MGGGGQGPPSAQGPWFQRELCTAFLPTQGHGHSPRKGSRHAWLHGDRTWWVMMATASQGQPAPLATLPSISGSWSLSVMAG